MIAEPVVNPHEYRAGQPSAEAIFHSIVRDHLGLVKHDAYNHNLRTNGGGDWQALIMGGGLGMAGTATATSATSLTTSGLTASAWIGYMLVAGGVYGIITANSTTVFTVDMWQSPATPGTAGTTPSSTTAFAVVPAGPSWFMALTSNATAPAATDTTLTSELAANGFTRALGTYSHTIGTTSYAVTHTFSCSGGAGTTINKEAIFTAANTTAGGVMTFESAEPSPPTLNSGDTLAQTVTVNY